LQIILGKKIDYNEAIKHLILFYKKAKRRMMIFKKFTKHIEGIKFDDAYELLVKERKRGEARL